MTITTAQLRERVASFIGVMAVDMPLDDGMADKIDRAITDATTFLQEKGLVWWADGAIPAPCALGMKLIVASFAAPECGKAGQGYEAGFADGQALLASIKPSAATGPVVGLYF